MRLGIFLMFSVGVLAALLLGATAAQHIQDQRRVTLAEQQAAADQLLITELGQQLKDARQALADRPVLERLVSTPCIQITDIKDEGNPTPRFSRDSQVFAGR